MFSPKTSTDPLFRCVICHEYPEDLVNCRYCTNFVCRDCIDGLFQHSSFDLTVNCPMCRQDMEREDFIKLGWLKDHIKWINDTIKIKKCCQHAKEELSIYCLTCTKGICAQCLLPIFNGEHIDHKYERVEAAQQRLIKIYDQQQNEITSILNQFDNRIEKKKSIIDQLLTLKKERLDEIEQFQINIKKQIESEANKEENKYQDQVEYLIERKIDYERKMITLKENIQSSNQMDLFKEEISFIEKILRQPTIPFSDKNRLTDQTIQNPLIVPWQTHRFRIENFFINQKENPLIENRQIVCNYDQHWSLSICTNEKSDYLCIEIVLNKGMSESIDYNIIIQLINNIHDDNTNNDTFNTIQSFKQGQKIIYNKFYKLNYLLFDGFINSDRNSMDIRFKFRPNSIVDERKLLQWQIESLKENEQNNDELYKENIRIKDQLNSLQQEYKQANQLIEDQTIKIQTLDKENSQLKLKRTQTTDHYHRDQSTNREDHPMDPDQRRTVVFAGEKRFKK